MPHYRCHFLDANGMAGKPELIDAPTTADAEQIAIALLYSRPEQQAVEMWVSDQKIFRYPVN